MKKILVTVFLMCFTLLLFSCSNKFENALPDEKKSTAVPSEAQNETQKNDTDLCVMDIPDARQISIELHNNVEYKVKTVMRSIKKTTLSLRMNVLNLLLDINEDVDISNTKDFNESFFTLALAEAYRPVL